jgi:hypothetical protein
MPYINFQLTDFPNKGIETVCETNTRKEAKYLILEYRKSDPSNKYWISQRPCKAW